MKLYTRQLNSIEELKREKKKLKKKLKKTSLIAPAKENKDDSTPVADPIMGAVLGALGSPILNLALGAFRKPVLSAAGKLIPKRAIMRVGLEFIGGYMKWKAVELGYKGIRSYMKKRKDKKATQNSGVY